MFDYIRIEANGTAQTDYLNRVLVRNESNDLTGEHYGFTKYEFGPVKIFQYKDEFQVCGSLHYLWHYLNNEDPKNNHSRFDKSQFSITVDTLCEILGVVPEAMKLKGYEYGFNLRTNFDPKSFVSQNLISLRRSHTELKRNHDTKGQYIGFGKDNRVLKIYDKAKQKGISGNLLRIENKITKGRVYGKEIQTLADLKRSDVWEYLKDKLTETIRGEMVIIDTPENHPQESNPKYWDGLNNRMARKRAFDRLPFSTMKAHILELIETTFKEMKEDRTESNAYPDKVLRLHNESSKEDKPRNTREDNRKRCLITGMDISHQIPRSRFISEKTVYSLTDELFNQLASEYLAESKQSHTRKKKAYYIAHNIRNAYHNARQNKPHGLDHVVTPIASNIIEEPSSKCYAY